MMTRGSGERTHSAMRMRERLKAPALVAACMRQ